jgi:hypothetical protein
VNRSQSIFVRLVAGLALLLGACSQGADETCQIDGDCSSGLMCCIKNADRGYCTTQKACDSSTTVNTDAGPDGSSLMSVDDAGGDAG